MDKKNFCIAILLITLCVLQSFSLLVSSSLIGISDKSFNEEMLTSQGSDVHAFWQWADVSGGSLGVKPGYDIAQDSTGNLYVAGSFYNSLIFDTLNETVELVSFGQNDIFLVKYTQNGECLWVKQAGGIGHDEALAITIDKDDNIIVTGYFEGVALFDGIILSSQGIYGIFIAKYTSEGMLIWVVQEGGSGLNTGYDISTDSENNILLTGRFMGVAFHVNAQSLVSYGNSDIFVAKYSSAGELLWACQAGGKDMDRAYSLAVDSFDTVYITGFFMGKAIFSGFNYDEVFSSQKKVLSSRGLADVFVASYSTNGKLLWVRSGGGIGEDIGFSIDADDTGIYVTGKYVGAACFDGVCIFSEHSRDDGFIMKYCLNGSLMFARKFVKQSGLHGMNRGRAVVASDTHYYVLGEFKKTIGFFNGVTLSCNTNPSNLWSTNSFIVKYDNEGTIVWVKQVGSLWDHVFSLVVDSNSHVYTTGSVSFSVNFDGMIFTDLGDGDFFIAKLTEVFF
jgi:hypothetical protein